jgi:hypothetical protein
MFSSIKRHENEAREQMLGPQRDFIKMDYIRKDAFPLTTNQDFFA